VKNGYGEWQRGYGRRETSARPARQPDRAEPQTATAIGTPRHGMLPSCQPCRHSEEQSSAIYCYDYDWASIPSANYDLPTEPHGRTD
jgi:hypothetical protein